MKKVCFFEIILKENIFYIEVYFVQNKQSLIYIKIKYNIIQINHLNRILIKILAFKIILIFKIICKKSFRKYAKYENFQNFPTN